MLLRLSVERECRLRSPPYESEPPRHRAGSHPPSETSGSSRLWPRGEAKISVGDPLSNVRHHRRFDRRAIVRMNHLGEVGVEPADLGRGVAQLFSHARRELRGLFHQNPIPKGRDAPRASRSRANLRPGGHGQRLREARARDRNSAALVRRCAVLTRRCAARVRHALLDQQGSSPQIARLPPRCELSKAESQPQPRC